MRQMHATAGNVRAEMARRGKTQSQIAALLGVTRQAVSRRLTGQTVFNIDELSEIATYLDVPLATLVAAPSDAETPAQASA